MTIEVGKVGMVSASSIIITERVREVMGDLDSLESNMKESGLISPLAVRDNKDETFTLIAGERRLIVLIKNNVELIPVRIFDNDLSELEMKVIEKSENFHRKDMEYWEFDKLTAEIHTIQQSIHGVKAPGPGQVGWSTENTGEMVGGMSKAVVSQAIKRADAREAYPELFEHCKTQSDASKTLKKIDEAMVKQVIAQKLENNTSNVTLTQLSKCYMVKSFFEGIKDIPDNIIHLVEIDPPYGIKLKDQKKLDSPDPKLNNYNEIPADDYILGNANTSWLGMRTVFEECYRVMADHSWLICWFAPEPWFETIYNELTRAGFSTTRMVGIWTKHNGQSNNPDISLANTYESFFYAWKGRPALNKPGSSNEFDHHPIPPNQKTHPTERPVELTTDIYNTFAFPGSRVLIPFAGSGNGLISAHQLGMSGVGFDIGKGYKDSYLIKVNDLK